MASSESKLRGLSFSASELKTITKWPDALVEDYLDIFQDLITISKEIDEIVITPGKADFVQEYFFTGF